MTQTVGAGGGKASRQFTGGLFKILRKQDFEHGVVYVADHLKIDAEINPLFFSLSHADPTVTGSNADGNFGGAMVQTTSPSATGTELAIAHKMGRIPVGWVSVGPAINAAGTVTWRQTRAPDTQNLYLKVVHAEDTNILTSLIIW
jgi:hypothetical protein